MLNHKDSMEERMEKTQKKLIRGVVVSDKMDKSVIVRVERTYVHKRLGKVMRTSKKYAAHDENEQARIGDTVEMYEGRPVSKTKYMYIWRVVS